MTGWTFQPYKWNKSLTSTKGLPTVQLNCDAAWSTVSSATIIAAENDGLEMTYVCIAWCFHFVHPWMFRLVVKTSLALVMAATR